MHPLTLCDNMPLTSKRNKWGQCLQNNESLLLNFPVYHPISVQEWVQDCVANDVGFTVRGVAEAKRFIIKFLSDDRGLEIHGTQTF